MLFNRLPSDVDVSKIMLKIMARERFAGASSIFVVVPTSEDEEEQGSANSVDSMSSIERLFTANTTSVVAPDPAPRVPLRTGLGSQVCGKGKKFYLREISSIETETMMKDEFNEISRPNEIVKILEKAAQAVGSDVTADRPRDKPHNAVNVTSRHIIPLLLNGKSVSWFRCKKSTESPEYNIAQCFERTCRPVPHRRYECSQKHQTTKSPSCSDYSPADLKDKRNGPAKVQMPSIESKRHERGTVPNNTGVAWFRSGLHKASASSSVPGCNIPVCTDLSSSLVPSYHGQSQQHQTPASAASWLCLSDLEVKKYPLANVGISWFRTPGVRNAFAACDIPRSCECDFRFSPEPPNYSQHRARGQQKLSKKDPKNNLKQTWNPIPKAGKSFNWFRLPRTHKTFPECDMPSCSEHIRHFCSGHPDHSEESRLDDLDVTRNRSAKAQKPSIRSERRIGQTATKNTGKRISWFRFPSSCKIPTACDTSTCDSSVLRHHKPPVQWNRSEWKPSPAIESETIPKISGVLKWLSWTRISSKRKKSAPSIPPCFMPQYPDSTSSPMLLDQAHHARAPCVSPQAELKVKRNRSAKVQKPSIQSIYQEGEATWQRVNLSGPCLASEHTSVPSIRISGVPTYIDSSCSPVPLHQTHHVGRNEQSQRPAPDDRKVKRNRSGVSLSWFRRSRLSLLSKHKTSSPSIQTCDVPEYVDCTCSPVQLNEPRHQGCNEQSQTSANSALCARLPDDRRVKSNRSGVSSSWSRIPWLQLPSHRKTSTPSIKTCDVRQYVDSSCSPVPVAHPRDYGCNEQSQTSAITFFACSLDDWKGNRNPSAKVQKPSIESIYHEGETTSKIAGVALSWSRLPSKRKTYVPAITSSGVSRYPRLLGRNELTQTPKPLYGSPTHDMEVMRKPSAKVQKRYIETVRREIGTAPKKSGIAGWLQLLPGMRKAPSKFPNKSKYMESFKGSKPKPNTTNLFVSISKPGGQRLSGQIFQLQQMSAIKQEYYREIYCPFRNPNQIPQPEFAKEIFKIPDFIDQQSAKSIKEIAPVRPKLASIKTIEQEGDRSISLKFKSPKSHQHPKTKRQSNENQPKLNTVTSSDLKPETDNPPMSKQITQPHNMSQIEKKEFRTIWPEQDQMPQLAKGIYIGPSSKRLDTGKIKKLGSEKTRSTSELKASKRKKTEKSQVLDYYIELDFADAIRYFASMNPERFQQLMQEELDSQLQTEDDKRKVGKKSEKKAKKGKKDKTTTTEVPISDESESDYRQGFKFSCAVKNGPTSLAGVDRSKIRRSR